MTVQINTNEELIFKQYLVIMNSLISSKKKLTELEIEVLSKFLYIDYLYKDLPKDKRDLILFNKITKDKIRTEIHNISTHSLNNALSKLRSKGMISINSLLVRTPIKNNQIELTFKLEIKE